MQQKETGAFKLKKECKIKVIKISLKFSKSVWINVNGPSFFNKSNHNNNYINVNTNRW